MTRSIEAGDGAARLVRVGFGRLGEASQGAAGKLGQVKARHGKGGVVSDQKNSDVVGYCDHCGKVTYLRRQAARRIARRHHPHKSCYRCPENDNFWHVGSLPSEVRQGVVDRFEYYNHRDGAA